MSEDGVEHNPRTPTPLEEPRFEDGPALRLAGLSGQFTPAVCDGIPALWTQFGNDIAEVPGRIGKIAYGACYGGGDPGSFTYLCGVEIPENADMPAGYTVLDVPPQHYAVFKHDGHISTIQETIAAIWRQWLPQSGRVALQAPCFERYGEDFDPATGLGGVEIWIPIQP